MVLDIPAVLAEMKHDQKTPMFITLLNIKMKKFIGSLSFLIISPTLIFAQQQIQTVLSNGGSININGQYSSVSVVGEMAVSSFSSTTFSGEIGYLNTEDELTRIKRKNELDNFIIYPNPNNGFFNLSFFTSDFNNLNIKIYDAIGQSISFNRVKTTNGLQINLSKVNQGIYFVVIEFDNTVIHKNLIIH
jgi:hypothetical protein